MCLAEATSESDSLPHGGVACLAVSKVPGQPLLGDRGTGCVSMVVESRCLTKLGLSRLGKASWLTHVAVWFLWVGLGLGQTEE